MTIKAPYNFVPLSKKVVLPHWANVISHDIPFEDGLSGSFNVDIEAKSPIFVRDGVSKKDSLNQDHNTVHKFFRYKDKYCIPASSLKGTIRNVLEIISFGNIRKNTQDKTYAVRDLNNQSLYRHQFKPQNVLCGWLQKNEDNSYSIQNCGLPGRISHQSIDEIFSTNLGEYFQGNALINGNLYDSRKDKYKSAHHKYQLLNGNKLAQTFSFELNDAGREVYKFNKSGDKKGEIVFTGQPGKRKDPQINNRPGKHLEFIFFESSRDPISVSDEVMENFFFAYFDHDLPRASIDWKWRREQLMKGEKIPVFFQLDEDDVKHLGLSYLYKLPYKYSVHDSIQNYQNNVNGLDMAECIFGYIDEKGPGLRSRVQISHAFATNTPLEDEVTNEVLSSPKASYYPSYIKQSPNQNGIVSQYKTFMNEDGVIAGWKRYPIHMNGIRNNPLPNVNNDTITTKFQPLKAGACFQFTVRYHNLRPIELGALLSAITFHNTPNTFHNIGMAKPLGYGKSTMTITPNDLNVEHYLKQFECYMNLELNQNMNWHETEQIIELIFMVSEPETAETPALEYMVLDDHRKAKGQNETLRRHSSVMGNGIAIRSLLDANSIPILSNQKNREIEILSKFRSIEDIVEEFRKSEKDRLEEKLKEKKAKWLQQLDLARIAIEEQERNARREEKAKLTRKQGLDLSGIDSTNRDAYQELKKEIHKYCKEYHALNNDKKLKEKFPDGYLPSEDHDAVMIKLNEIYANLRGGEQQKWRKSYEDNAILKKIADWIGEENAWNIRFDQ